MKKLLSLMTGALLVIGLAGLSPTPAEAQERGERRSHDRGHDRGNWSRDGRSETRRSWDRDGRRHNREWRNRDRDGWRDRDRFRRDWDHRDWRRDRHFRSPSIYIRPYGYYDYRWRIGHRLPRTYYAEPYHIVDYRWHGLPMPPYGYRWVRVDDDAFLVAITTGVVADIVYNLFR